MLVTAPASLLDQGLQYASGGRLLLANASGTVWQGSATPALRMQDGSLVALSSFHWKIAAPSLLAGKILVQLHPDDQPSATEATLFLDRIELRHAQLGFPARLLGETSMMLKPVQLRGQLQVQADHLTWSGQGIRGSAVVDWRHASSVLSGDHVLGDYRMALDGAGERMHIVLATTSGMLLLEGDGNWLAGRGLEFHGKASASSGNYDTLTELLHHLGPEISPGVHTFDFVPQ